MSVPEPPELPLEEARAHLARKGYLRAALPPTPPSPWRAGLRGALRAGLLALVSAWGTVAAAGVDRSVILVLAVGYLPLAAVALGVGALAGRWLGQALLRLGASPAGVADGLAAFGGLGMLGVLAAAVWGGAEHPMAAVVLPWLAGTILAIEVVRAGRMALERRFSFAVAPASRMRRCAPFVVVAVAGIGFALPALTQRSERRGQEPAASFPRPAGRVAVLAVDGLAREDLVALAASDPAWRSVGTWGWAPLAVGDATMPAVLWTTVACGVPPAEHGVHVLDEVRLFGDRDGVPLRGLVRSATLVVWGPLGLAQVVARPASERRAATFWEMASRAGCPVTVGGWWGSWPVRRVLGDVVSERAWLGGGSGEDAVTPALAETVRRVWAAAGGAAAATDALAVALARRAAADPSPHLCALSLPALDLLRRRHQLPPVALAAASRDHLAHLAATIAILAAGGYDVWLVGVPWGPGTPFVACSAAGVGPHADVSAEALASTWLVELGLPPPAGAGAARRDLLRDEGPSPPAAFYGPPPPPLAAPPLKALEVQREVLRNLGYLQ